MPWRERVNPHPLFKDIIQFNSLAPALAPIGLMGYLAERDKQRAGASFPMPGDRPVRI